MVDPEEINMVARGALRAYRFIPFGISVAIAIFLAACGGSSVSGFEASDVYHFESVPEMVATSDLVIVGRVTDAGKGRTVGPEGEEIQYRAATISIEKVLSGSYNGSSLTIESLDLQEFDKEWRNADVRIVAFVTDDPRSTVYFPVSSQAVFLVDGAGDLAATVSETFTEQVGSLSLAELEAEVAEANDLIARGQVAPDEPFTEG